MTRGYVLARKLYQSRSHLNVAQIFEGCPLGGGGGQGKGGGPIRKYKAI
jgi:hypothetical protein